ncbi:MAG: hypothetical protein C4584_01040 [Armatimonadetes bacterium]|nr:MAG: hypothetical protein C4584_01040 [Armatimonadota bacterium]
MKKTIGLVLLLIFPLLAGLLFFTGSAAAQKQPNQTTLPSTEVVDQDYFASGDVVSINGTVNGDAYVFGGSIIIDGTVNGDLLVMGGTVDVSGTVTDDVRAIGGQVTVRGEVGGNISVVAGSVNTTNDAVVGGNMVVTAGSLSIFGPITGDVNAGAGQITVGDSIGGNVTVGTGQIVLTPNARISGDLSYSQDAQAQIQPGAVVEGQVQQNVPSLPKMDPGVFARAFTGAVFFTLVIFLISYLIVGLLLLRFFPAFIQGTTETIRSRFLASLGVGFLITVLTPVIIMLLLITVVGVPFALILALIFFLMVFLAKIIVSLIIGQWILGWGGRAVNNGWALFIGLIVYGILVLLPFAGGITFLLVVFVGLGAIFLERRRNYYQLREKELA